MSTVRWGRGRARRASRWLGVLGVGPVLVIAAVLMPVTRVAAGDARSSPDPGSPTVVAEGSFGRVAGVPGSAEREPEPDALPVLDAWATGTHIRFEPTQGTLAPWRVTAIPQPAGSGGPRELGTGDGDAAVTLGSPGLFLIRLDGTIRPDGGAHEGSWWWRVAVPDRTLPEDETGPPPPALRLASGDDVVVLEQGSGCFLGTCGDIGRISPPDLLPTLRTIPGAPLSLTLADGSGMDGWTIGVTPVEGGVADDRVLGRVTDTWATHGWVPAPGVGDWVLAASVTFDRERGAFDGYARLVVGPSGG